MVLGLCDLTSMVSHLFFLKLRVSLNVLVVSSYPYEVLVGKVLFPYTCKRPKCIVYYHKFKMHPCREVTNSLPIPIHYKVKHSNHENHVSSTGS